jgi:chromosome partitioning protein
MTILQYDAGSRGALAYLDAAKELNSRADRLDGAMPDDRASTGTEESR